MNPQTSQVGSDKIANPLVVLQAQHEANQDSTDRTPEEKAEIDRRIGVAAVPAVATLERVSGSAIQESLAVVNAYTGQDALAANAHDSVTTNAA